MYIYICIYVYIYGDLVISVLPPLKHTIPMHGMIANDDADKGEDSGGGLQAAGQNHECGREAGERGASDLHGGAEGGGEETYGRASEVDSGVVRGGRSPWLEV